MREKWAAVKEAQIEARIHRCTSSISRHTLAYMDWMATREGKEKRYIYDKNVEGMIKKLISMEVNEGKRWKTNNFFPFIHAFMSTIILLVVAFQSTYFVSVAFGQTSIRRRRTIRKTVREREREG